jgi:hypothetical protein
MDRCDLGYRHSRFCFSGLTRKGDGCVRSAFNAVWHSRLHRPIIKYRSIQLRTDFWVVNRGFHLRLGRNSYFFAAKGKPRIDKSGGLIKARILCYIELTKEIALVRFLLLFFVQISFCESESDNFTNELSLCSIPLQHKKIHNKSR